MSNQTGFEDCCQVFAESFETSNLPAMLAVERTVLGCDYGGTSWTTRRQAEQITDSLELCPGTRLLDIGAGSGWPGLWLADNADCHVTLVDLPANALVRAQQRACRDGIEGRVDTVAGSGATLPFRDCSFGAINHSDVLCCLPEKREMLRECRRVASDGANMLFSVIAISPRLPHTDHRRAIEVGPPFVEAPGDYADLLSETDWRLVDRKDVTAEYRKCLRVLVDAFDGNVELCDALGADVVSESRGHRLEQVAAVDAGLLCREIFVAAAG
jgi:SAM-dependent methyltransferase